MGKAAEETPNTDLLSSHPGGDLLGVTCAACASLLVLFTGLFILFSFFSLHTPVFCFFLFFLSIF